MKADAYLSAKSQGFVLALGTAAMGLIGGVDYLWESDFELDILYLLPIVLVTWYASTNLGYAAAFAAALTWRLSSASNGGLTAGLSVTVWDVSVELIFYLTIVFLLSSLKRRSLHLEELSNLDPLTGVANKPAFTRAIEMEAIRSRRYGLEFSLAYLDIDNFKSVNDTLGHLAGDETLRRFARILQESVRATDTVARLGGDEFAILLPHTSAAGALYLAHRIQRLVQLRRSNSEAQVNFSMGMVTFRQVPSSVDEILGHADALMYSVKADGKNGFEVLEWPHSAGS